jgi:hypothetical protein
VTEVFPTVPAALSKNGPVIPETSMVYWPLAPITADFVAPVLSVTITFPTTAAPPATTPDKVVAAGAKVVVVVVVVVVVLVVLVVLVVVSLLPPPHATKNRLAVAIAAATFMN